MPVVLRFTDDVLPYSMPVMLCFTEDVLSYSLPVMLCFTDDVLPYSMPVMFCFTDDVLSYSMPVMFCYTDDVLSYSMPEGEKRGMEVDLRDFTYDGKRHENNLTDGLGQLTDWELGYYNFRLDLTDSGRKGFEWIGWRDDSNSTFANIEIVAQFMNQRNFTAVRIHCNNMFSKDVRVFRRAEIYSSIGGKLYLGKPIVFDYEQDDNIEFGRYVTIPLPHVVGQFLKIRLYFAARWIMISEMRFESRKNSVTNL